MSRTNQSTIIKDAINSYLDNGISDKQDIYSKVVDELAEPPNFATYRITRN